jgi:hypothetical protein
LELDPIKRLSAKEALEHVWIKEGLKSAKAPKLLQPVASRRREEEQLDPYVYEVSPARPVQDKPLKSLTKHLNFQAVKIGGLDEDDSNTSTPLNEGGI